MTTPPYLKTVLERMDREADRVRIQKFSIFFGLALEMSEQRYSTWKQRHGLQGLEPEDCIAVIRARLSGARFETNVSKWTHAAAWLREARSLRATRKIAERFSPQRMAAE